MQPAIPMGTLLQNRYRIVQLLGQGGFGRTYLAEDQGRFNERCAIKEFVPSQGEDRFSDKASQLFQREAAILYQISHPQIPQFRATFEQDQRLFLIQDFVDGTTYRDWLNQRRNQGSAFSETEVRQFLQQLLPVLGHIHSKGIIHRDISPDNVILRRSDQMPVLIDFGVVKEVVTRIQMSGVETPATTVGKIGYAPSEQMQTGRAYPSSDLYSLAVTAVVLLTAKEPQELFDDVNLSWNWQRYAQVSPQLAQVLNKALNYRPNDRYQAVAEMLQALSGGASANAPMSAPMPAPIPASVPVPGSPMTPPQPAAPPMSEMRTVAVGRAAPIPQNQPITQRSDQRTVGRSAASPSDTASGGLLENPWAVTAIGVGSAVVAGIGGWAVVNFLGNPPATPTPTITPMPTLTQSPTPTAEPTVAPPKAEPTTFDQSLDIQEGESKTIEGNVKEGDTVNYRIQAKSGQVLSASLRGEGVLLSVLDPDGNPVSEDADRAFRWSGSLENEGEYIIALSPVQGLSRSDYRLEVSLNPAPVATPSPDATSPPDEDQGEGDTDSPDQEGNSPPDDSIQPRVNEQQVQFPAGQTGTLLANSVGPGRVQRYTVNAQQGQIMTVQFTETQGPVTFDVRLPGGEPVEDASDVLFWQSYLPLGGNYSIDVKSPQDTSFTMEIQVIGQP
jgi:serine/threonine protein kinase